MLSWEQRFKAEEEKHASIFEKQKNAILAQKLADQQAELLKSAN